MATTPDQLLIPRIVSVILLGCSLISTLVSSVVNLKHVREFQDQLQPHRWNWGVQPERSAMEDNIQDLITYHAVFLTLAVLHTPPLIYLCLRGKWKALAIGTAFFGICWIIKLMIYLNTDRLFYRWLAAFAPRAENVAHLFSTFALISCSVLVLLQRSAKQQELRY